MTENTDTRWVWREGFGWVERPVEQPVEDEQTEDEQVAVAA